MAGWIGEDNFPAVLNLTHTRNEADLIVMCPAYEAMAAVAKSLKMDRLQYSIDKVLGNRGIEHLVAIVTP